MRNDVAALINFYLKEEDMLINKSELARRLGCDPRTIDRYIKIQKGEIPERKKRIYTSILDEYKGIIDSKVDKYGATAKAVYYFIKKKGYTGKYSIVARYVKQHKDEEQKKATIRFETIPGLQAQVDWKEELSIKTKDGNTLKVNIFLMILGYSRTKFLCLTTDRTQETLFECLTKAFQFFDGVPEEILFDNMKTVVDRSKSNFSHVEFNERFKHFATDAGFKPLACRAYRPQTKGKVEALAKFTNRLVVFNEEIESYDELESIVDTFCTEINNEISQATGEKPFTLLKKEKEYLLQMPSLECLKSYVSPSKTYKIHKDSMVVHKGKRYSVPIKYIGKKVSLRVNHRGYLCIYYNQDKIACHQLSDKKFNYSYEHMQEILKSDACREMSYDEIDSFIKDNLSGYDNFLGGK